MNTKMRGEGIKGRGTNEKITTFRVNARSLKGVTTIITTVCILGSHGTTHVSVIPIGYVIAMEALNIR